jgi:hypothetical protein
MEPTHITTLKPAQERLRRGPGRQPLRDTQTTQPEPARDLGLLGGGRLGCYSSWGCYPPSTDRQNRSSMIQGFLPYLPGRRRFPWDFGGTSDARKGSEGHDHRTPTAGAGHVHAFQHLPSRGCPASPDDPVGIRGARQRGDRPTRGMRTPYGGHLASSVGR